MGLLPPQSPKSAASSWLKQNRAVKRTIRYDFAWREDR